MYRNGSYRKESQFLTLARLVIAVAALALVLGPAFVDTSRAEAAVYPSCTVSGCSDARSSNTIWKSKGYPGDRGWKDWPNGRCNFSGGTFQNRERQLPANGSYLEFDVNPRDCGARRDAERIVINRTDGTVYYSPNHYADFYRL